MVISILSFIFAIIIYIVGGYFCGRICSEIIDKKNPEYNKILWFWAGFFFNVIAVFMTLVVKDTRN